MRRSSLFKPTFLTLCMALASAAPLAAHAQDGYATSSDGKIVRTAFGLCVHTADWTPAKAVAECDPVQTLPAPAVVAPQPAPAPAPLAAHNDVSIDVRFAFDSDKLSPQQRDVLRQGWEQAKADGQVVTVRIVGHTDVEGTAAYNQTLSERRAVTVAKTLEAWGANPADVQTEGRGKQDADSDCHGVHGLRALRACHAPDRHAAVTVTFGS